MKLNGKVALITGAASGIGHAIAKRYVEADGRVVIADLDPTKAAQAATEYRPHAEGPHLLQTVREPPQRRSSEKRNRHGGSRTPEIGSANGFGQTDSEKWGTLHDQLSGGRHIL